ncbi:MFS transporter [Actinacidiphila rubida]|uniref:Predicted arabinose efflux permease, MFS family n=1 Tax=Actinacidiphila rubida TaxID=310780 RepID=A0A1H8KAT1_9ACTN|nr:MFS transporter [Actinacidiphila rubida]SEN90034.1 Predicted arabinose efflux permease, MFS family [Actinacidiphila rubida]
MSQGVIDGVAAVQPPPTRWGLWAARDFRRLWIGETSSGLGTAVGNVSLALVAVVVLGSSPVMTGVLTAAAWVPWLLVGLPAGAWVDRWPRRSVMLVGDVLLAVLFGSIPVAYWAGVLGIGQLVAVALLAGTVKVFFSTAYGAVLPSLVRSEDLLEANVKLRAGESAAEVAGPGVAGLLVQAVGAVTGLLFDAVTYLVSALLLSGVHPDEQPPPVTERQPVRKEIAEGVRFVARDPYLRTLACFGALGNLALNGIQAVQTVFLFRTVGLSPGGIGVVFAVVSLGGLAGAGCAGRVARLFGAARGLLVCMLVVAPLMFLVPLAGMDGVPLAVSVAAWGLAVAGVVAGNVLAGSFFQGYCPRRMLGRIRATASTVNYSAIPLGALLGGFLGAGFGTRTALWTMAAVLLGAGVLLLASPLRGQRDFPAAPRTDS